MFFFGIKKHVRSPIFDLIFHYYDVLQEMLNEKAKVSPAVYEEFIKITCLERNDVQNIIKMDSTQMILQNFCPNYRFDVSVLQFLVNDCKNSNNVDVIICFQLLKLLFENENKELEENENYFSLFIDCLVLVIKQKSPIDNVVNLIIDELLSRIASFKSSKWSNNFLSSILDLISNGAFQQASDFKKVSPFLREIPKLKNESLSKKLLNMIIDMHLANSPLFQIDNFQQIICIISFYIKELNCLAITILEYFIRKELNFSIEDQYVVISTEIIQLILNSEQNNHEVVKGCEDPISKMKKDKSILKLQYNFVPELKEKRHIESPPYDILEERVDYSLLISENVFDRIKEFEFCFRSNNEQKNCEIVHQKFLESFFAFLKIYSHNNAKSFTQICACFLFLAKNTIKKDFLEKNLSYVMCSLLMDPAIHIFNDEKFDVYINTLRNSFLEMVINIDPELILNILFMNENNVCLFTEFLIRILEKRNELNLSVLNNDKFHQILVFNGCRLQELNKTNNSKVIQKTRNSYFVFLSEYALDPLTSYFAFSSPKFVNNFFRYIYELPLSSSIIITFKTVLFNLDKDPKKLNFNHIIKLLYNIVLSCNKNNNDILYQDLCINLSANIVLALKHKPQYSLLFEPIVEPLLDFVLSQMNSDVFSNVLDLYLLISTQKNNFDLNDIMFQKLYKCIKEIYGDEPSLCIESTLFNLMSESINSNSNSLFLIKAPSILPLILASFGKSQRLPIILTKIQNLCKYSDFNIRKCHDGELDLILSHLLCSNSEEINVSYKDCTFPVKNSKKTLKKIIIPLLATIIISKSNNVNVHCLIDYLVKKPTHKLCKFLDVVISKCQIIPSTIFSLTYGEPFISVSGIDSSDLNNGFTIHFMMNLDIQLLLESNIHIEILKIIDNQGNTFVIFINQSVLYAKYESSSKRTTVKIYKSPPSNEWVHVTVIVKFIENNVKLSNYSNTKKLNGSELCNFKFSDGETKFVFGGIDETKDVSKEWKCHQFGKFGDFHIFKGELTPKQINNIIKSPWKIVDESIFNTNTIKNSSHKCSFSVPLKNHPLRLKSKNLKINVYDTFPVPQSFLDVIVNSDDFNYILNFFNEYDKFPHEYTSVILGLLGSLFKRSINTQEKFYGIDKIIYNLYKYPKMLIHQIYSSFIEVFNTISFAKLRKIWFDNFILNPWLWSKGDSEHFYIILCHWKNDLILSYTDLFQNFSYFSSLLNQYMILFNEHEGEYKKYLNETFNIEIFRQCQSNYLTFLANVSSINLSKDDIKVLFNHIINWKNKNNLLQLLDLAKRISLYILKLNIDISIYLLNLHSLIDIYDIDIIENCVILICSLSNTIENTIALGLQFSKNSLEKQYNILLKICQHIKEYNNLFSLICILGLNLGKDKYGIVCESLTKITKIPFNELSFSSSECWFIYPLLLALTADYKDTQIIYDFISYILIEDDLSFSINFNQIYLLILLISNIYELEIPHTYYFIKSIYSNIKNYSLGKEYIQQIIDSIFNISFYSLYKKSYHRKLIKEIDNVFSITEYDFFKHSEKKEKFNYDIDFLTSLVNNTNINSLDYVFSYNCYKSGIWKNYDIAKLGALLINNNYDIDSISQKYKVLFYFLFKNVNDDSLYEFKKLPDEEGVNLMAESENIIESNRIDFNQLNKENLNLLFQYIKKEQDNVNKILYNRTQALNDQSDIIISNEIKFQNSKMPNIFVSNPKYVRDYSHCKYFFIPKIKVKSNFLHRHVYEEEIIRHDPPLLICKNIFLVRGNKKKICTFYRYINSYEILIENTHKRVQIPFSQISFCLKKKKETHIEIFLKNGKTYLIDFTGSEIPKNLIGMLTQLDVIFSSTKSWLNNIKSNFDMIIYMNHSIGRSFNDSTYYPFFPNILKSFNDYSPKTDIFSNICDNFINNKANDIQKYFDNNNLISADYFFSNELNFELPSWASSTMEFVYKLRKLLESKEITEQLNKFINAIIKEYRIYSGKTFFQIPQKELMDLHYDIPNELELFFDDRIVVASTPLNNNNGIQMIFDDGSIAKTEFSFNENSKTSQVMILGNIDMKDHITYYSENGNIIVFSRENHKIKILNDSKVKTCLDIFSESNLIAQIDDNILFCPDSSTVSCISEGKLPNVLCHSYEQISLLSASSNFNIFVFSTIDCYIHVHSGINGKLVKEYKLQNEANKILITKKWGFIIAFTSKNIYLFDVNGTCLKNIELSDEYSIARWYTFSSREGFDYIIFENEFHNLYYFEAFYPEKIKFLCELNEESSGVLVYQLNSQIINMFILMNTGKIKNMFLSLLDT